MKRWVFLCVLAAMLVLPFTGLAGDLPPNPIKDAKVGEWVLYQMMGPMQQKQTVTAVHKDAVTVKIDIIMNGKVVSTVSNKIRFDQKGPGAPPQGSPKFKMGKATVQVKGHSLDCITTEVKAQGKTIVTYISPDIPVFGVVQTNMNGQPLMKLLDWGK